MKCSKCKRGLAVKWNYCPMCGQEAKPDDQARAEILRDATELSE